MKKLALFLSLFSLASVAHAVELSKTRPVLLVHGWEMYSVAKTDCANKFRPIINELKNQGFTGPFLTVTYYQDSTNCDINLAKYNAKLSKNSSWRDIGQIFSNYVFDKYSRFGQPVDVLGHSMGGLVVRSAILGGYESQTGFSNILVEDAVTVATPHLGSSVSAFCIYAQCKSLSPTNPDFRWLSGNVKPNGMTDIDWSVQGSTLDALVNTNSSMAMGLDARHKKLFNGLTHNNQLTNPISVNYMVKSLGTSEQ